MPADFEWPSGYVAQCEMVSDLVRGWLDVRSADPPRFRMPPDGVMIAAGLDQVPLVAINGSARRLAALIIESTTKTFGEPATVLMLRAALKLHNVRVERCSLDALGLAF